MIETEAMIETETMTEMDMMIDEMVADRTAHAGAPSRRRVVVADVVGFCFGVRRAVEMVEQTRAGTREPVTTLGPIIHNRQVTDRLQQEGVETESDLAAIQRGTVVLSAHGVAPAVVEQARAQRLHIVDVTCPFVTRVHRTARQLLEQGYELLIVGDHGHTEVRGILGAVDGRAIVVSCVEDARALPLGRKVAVVSQTTQKTATFAQIVGEVAARATDVRAVNTVCNATDELQQAAVRLARETDVVIVVGGRQSANTRRLRETIVREGTPAHQVETAAEVQEAWLEGHEVIGVTAGASTPDWIIRDVVARLGGDAADFTRTVHHPDE